MGYVNDGETEEALRFEKVSRLWRGDGVVQGARSGLSPTATRFSLRSTPDLERLPLS